MRAAPRSMQTPEDELSCRPHVISICRGRGGWTRQKTARRCRMNGAACIAPTVVSHAACRFAAAVAAQYAARQTTGVSYTTDVDRQLKSYKSRRVKCRWRVV